jgi:ABC-type sugar transport system substrate-binding protein
MIQGTPTTDAAAPTVVLVHGAFADASGWNGVVERLQAAGVPVAAVLAPLLPLLPEVT